LLRCYALPEYIKGMKIKLSDIGTTGLIQYCVEGNQKMRGARIGQAVKEIAKRYRSYGACVSFRAAVNAALIFNRNTNKVN